MNALTLQLIYLIVGVALSAVVLWRLHRSGRMLLGEAMGAKPQLARLMSHAVTVGCSLIMFGYIAVSIWPLSGFGNAPEIFFELELQKIGYLCLMLGAVCFFHVFLVTLVSGAGRHDVRKESMPV
jgi:hypothetical protein